MPRQIAAKDTANLNGRPCTFVASAERTLLKVIREDFGLLGTSEGCGAGDCGACAVLVDGQRMLACLTKAGSVRGRSITTVEGISSDTSLRAAVDVFYEDEAFRCGVCAPGMVISVIAYLNEQPDLSDASLIARMNTNTCNCCGYGRIHAAIKRAAKALRAANEERATQKQATN